MLLSIKQKNVINYRYRDVLTFAGIEIQDALFRIMNKEFDPYDATTIISCIFDLGKDERENVTPEYKKKVVEELKELVEKYDKPHSHHSHRAICPACKKEFDGRGGICCYADIGNRDFDRKTNWKIRQS